MSAPDLGSSRLTDERLRTYLAGNQPERERMCALLLPLLGPYTNVRPRRPLGGPDGARDLEATFKGEVVAWGAVGFRNLVSDSPADRTWAKKKFKSDVAGAKKQKPDLRA